MLRERFGVSERRACTVVGLHRSTMRLAPPRVCCRKGHALVSTLTKCNTNTSQVQVTINGVVLSRL